MDVYVDDNEKLNEVINSKDFVVLSFYTEWSGPWEEYQKLLKKISEVRDKISFVYIDCEKNKEICEKYQVKSVPINFFYKKGKLSMIKSGLIKYNELENTIKVLEN